MIQSERKQKEQDLSSDESQDPVHSHRDNSYQEISSSHLSQNQNLNSYLAELYSDVYDSISIKNSTRSEAPKKRYAEDPKTVKSVEAISFDKSLLGNQNEMSLMELVESRNALNLIELEQQILKNGIFTKSDFFTEELLILGTSHSKYHEIVTLQVQLSCYKTKIQILNNTSNNHIHNEGELGGFGAFGNVYFIKFQHEQYAVKCINFNQSKAYDLQSASLERERLLVTVIQQYFFLLLFSTLQIGPKVNNIMGFDMIVTQECIEFSTEICYNQEITINDVEKIKNLLRKMHILKIVHRDIKPDNIMYSQTFKKHVFIDFGGCLILKESVGQKTLTNFLGTTGFCSDEMFNLLGNSKNYVDLYYNDLYGLKRTFQRYKEYKNLDHKFLIDKQQSESSIIKNMINPFLLLNWIKYLAYNELYNDFVLYWKVMEKRHMGQIDEIQIELLWFFMDIEPNQSLRDFYWKYIDQHMRNQSEFEELKDIFAYESNDSLSIWKQMPQKEKKLALEIQFYRKLAINNGRFTQKQKKIKRVLLNKASIEKFIFSKEYFLNQTENAGQQKQKFSLLQQIEKQRGNILSQMDIGCYFLVVVNYCSFAQNKYDADFDSKTRASKLAVEIIQKYFFQNYPIMEEIFKCNIQVKVLVKMFQYFIWYLWQDVLDVFKDSSIFNCISSLFLLGYPTDLKDSKRVLGYKVISDNSSRVKKIMRFWQFNLSHINFGGLLYNRNYENFLYRSSPSQILKIGELCKQVMQASQDYGEDSFFRLNHYIYVNIYCNHVNLNQYTLTQAFVKLESFQVMKDISKEDFDKWKKIINIILGLLTSVYQIHYKKLDFKELKRYNTSVLLNDMSCLPYLFNIPNQKYEVWSFYKKLEEIMKIIDKIINYDPIRQRYFTSCRLLIAYRAKDYNKLKILLGMIVQTSQKFSILNMFTLNEQLKVVRELVQHGTERFWLNFANFVYEKSLFEEIIQRSMDIASFYSNLDIESNPLTQFQGETKTELKGVIMVVNSLHRVLHNLRLIHEKYLSLKSRKQAGNLNIDNSLYFGSQYEKKHMTSLQQIKSCLLNIVEKIQLKPYMKDDRDSKNQYVIHMMNFYITQKQYSKAEQLFESEYGVLFNMQQSKQMKPILNTFVIYCILKAESQSKDNFWNERLLNVYQECKLNNMTLNPMRNPQVYRAFLLAMIYCRSSYDEIESLLRFITESLRAAPTKVNASNFQLIIQSRFWCTCLNCFPKPLINWNSTEFIEFVENKISSYDEIKESYMSLVFYYFLESPKISLKSKTKFVNFIRKSLKHLSLPIRSKIAHRLNLYTVNFYDSKTGLKIFFQQYKDKIHSNHGKSKNEQSREEAKFVRDLRLKFDEKTVRKHLYFYAKHLKNNKGQHNLRDTVEQQFFYKEKFINNWRPPLFIKEIYRRKLMKYHVVKQNYIPSYPPSQIEISMRMTMR